MSVIAFRVDDFIRWIKHLNHPYGVDNMNNGLKSACEIDNMELVFLLIKHGANNFKECFLNMCEKGNFRLAKFFARYIDNAGVFSLGLRYTMSARVAELLIYRLIKARNPTINFNDERFRIRLLYNFENRWHYKIARCNDIAKNSQRQRLFNCMGAFATDRYFKRYCCFFVGHPLTYWYRTPRSQ